MKIGVVAWGKSNCFGVKWQVGGERAWRDKKQETRDKKKELIGVECLSPDGSGNPFVEYTEQKIVADSGK